jgi:DNA-binding CsgD family transcriptional regulator
MSANRLAGPANLLASRYDWMQRRRKCKVNTSSGSSCQLPAPRLPSEVCAQVARLLGLSHRESQVLEGIFGGADELEIAGRHQLSAHTVHTYTLRLYRKAGVSSRAQLLASAFLAYVTHDDSCADGTVDSQRYMGVDRWCRGPGKPAT